MALHRVQTKGTVMQVVMRKEKSYGGGRRERRGMGETTKDGKEGRSGRSRPDTASVGEGGYAPWIQAGDTGGRAAV